MKAFFSYLFSILTFLAPIKGLIYLISACVMVDASLGMYIVFYIVSESEFEFEKFFRIFKKLTFYISTIILCFLFDKYILENELFGINLFLSKFVTCIWVFKELKSIDKNWIILGNTSIIIAVKDFIKDLKCIKNNIDDLRK